MTTDGFSTSFTIDQSPDGVFWAINSVRSWWSGTIDGETHKFGAEFTYLYQDFHRRWRKFLGPSITRAAWLLRTIASCRSLVLRSCISMRSICRESSRLDSLLACGDKCFGGGEGPITAIEILP